MQNEEIKNLKEQLDRCYNKVIKLENENKHTPIVSKDNTFPKLSTPRTKVVKEVNKNLQKINKDIIDFEYTSKYEISKITFNSPNTGILEMIIKWKLYNMYPAFVESIDLSGRVYNSVRQSIMDLVGMRYDVFTEQFFSKNAGYSMNIMNKYDIISNNVKKITAQVKDLFMYTDGMIGRSPRSTFGGFDIKKYNIMIILIVIIVILFIIIIVVVVFNRSSTSSSKFSSSV